MNIYKHSLNYTTFDLPISHQVRQPNTVTIYLFSVIIKTKLVIIITKKILKVFWSTNVDASFENFK